MTETQAVYVYLYFGEWLTMRDIGRLLDVDHSAVCRGLKRGLARISQYLGDQEAIFLNTEALADALYRLYESEGLPDEIVPKRARTAMEKARNSGYKRVRPKELPEVNITATSIHGSKYLWSSPPSAEESSLLKALRERSSQKAGSILQWLSMLVNKFRKKYRPTKGGLQ